MQQTGMANFSQSWQRHWHHKASNLSLERDGNTGGCMWGHVSLLASNHWVCLQSLHWLASETQNCSLLCSHCIAQSNGYASSLHCMYCLQHLDPCPIPVNLTHWRTCDAGYLVVRCYCKQKEQRRQRMFEKALDAAATSPFARGVTRWLLAGFVM